MTDFYEMERRSKIQRLNQRKQLDLPEGPAATGTALVCMLCAILLCIWGATGGCDNKPAPQEIKHVNDAPQRHMEAVSWARHYEGRK